MSELSFFYAFDFTGQLKNKLPTVSVGLSLTLAAFVILTGQVVLYFRKASIHCRDSLWVKGIVIFIWMVQALEVALTCHMTSLAHSHDSIIAVGSVQGILWEWAISIGTNAITESLVHAFFISRIYLLEPSACCVRISMILSVILILEGSSGFVCILFLIISNLRSSRHVILSWAMPLWLGLSILADVSIAGSIYYILKKNGPYLSMRLSLLVQKLIKFCIQTGLITSLATGITAALWIAAGFNLGHLFMSFPLGGIYATCFMTNLIARESYFHHMGVDEHSECFGIVTRSITFATHEDSGKDQTEVE